MQRRQLPQMPQLLILAGPPCFPQALHRPEPSYPLQISARSQQVIVHYMADTPSTPPSRLPPRLLRQGSQCWMSHQRRPQPTTRHFVPPSLGWEPRPVRTLTEIMNDHLIQGASCLLQQHPSVLQMAGDRMLHQQRKTPEVITWAVSVLLTAAFRQMGPMREWELHPKTEPHPETQDSSRLDQVEAAVYRLIGPDRTVEELTDAARRLVLEDPEEEEECECWVMEVLLTAVRIVDMRERAPGDLETLRLDTELPWHHGVFSILNGVEAAEGIWMTAHGGFSWPYGMQEVQHIMNQHRPADSQMGELAERSCSVL
jgi:hypothetical protein